MSRHPHARTAQCCLQFRSQIAPPARLHKQCYLWNSSRIIRDIAPVALRWIRHEVRVTLGREVNRLKHRLQVRRVENPLRPGLDSPGIRGKDPLLKSGWYVAETSLQESSEYFCPAFDLTSGLTSGLAYGFASYGTYGFALGKPFLIVRSRQRSQDSLLSFGHESVQSLFHHFVAQG